MGSGELDVAQLIEHEALAIARPQDIARLFAGRMRTEDLEHLARAFEDGRLVAEWVTDMQRLAAHLAFASVALRA